MVLQLYSLFSSEKRIYKEKIKKNLILIFILNIIDYITTITFIKYFGMIEINPVMIFLFSYNLDFLFKVLFFSGTLFIYWNFLNKKNIFNKFILNCFRILNISYLLVIYSNIYGLILLNL
jgi:hypothetical protein